MKLELTGEEVVAYMTMRQHIIDLNNYISDLKKELTIAYSSQPSKTEEPIKPTASKPRWTIAEKNLLTDIRNKNGKYSGVALDSILHEFPGRSRDAVAKALRSKGIHIKNGYLKYTIKETHIA